MNATPWFDPMWAWLPGTLYGTTLGLWGGVAGMLAPRGKARGLVLGVMAAYLALAVVFLFAGVIALVTKQPYGVWYALLLPGVIGLFVVGLNYPVIRAVYQRAEVARMSSKDFQP